MRGSCLCGAVRFEVDGGFTEMHHCHCSRCRKAHGAAFATFARTTDDALRVVAGADAVRDFAPPESARRSFCGQCGASLFFRYEQLKPLVWVAAAALDEDPGMRPQAHIFVGSKAAWHELHEDGLPQFEELPPQI